MNIFLAQLENQTFLRLHFSEAVDLTVHDVIITPIVGIHGIEARGNELLLTTSEFDLSRQYSVLVRGAGMKAIDFGPCLASLKPTAMLGCILADGFYTFRLFAPRARTVRLYLYDRPEQSVGTEYFLAPAGKGVWEIALHSSVRESYYAYRVDGPDGEHEKFNPQITIGDPYAVAVLTANTWRHPARCVLPGLIPAYDWEDDAHVVIEPEDLVIYEMHVRDMTAHASSGVDGALAGTYRGLTQTESRGGLRHLRELGINAIELMPCQHFASIEPPYLQHVSDELYNHWNPYERNHWGYMTSYFFAPEPRYSESANTEAGLWNTAGPAHINEFRDMVKAMHRAGIAVIMDVVYNHTSQYDYQPLRYIDRKYYYRHSADGQYSAASGCGNDFATEMPMARRIIVESILHWIREYHIDGFRFDLATMIDTETLLQIRKAVEAEHPGVILIAEPWGGGKYDLKGFSQLGMLAWNDIIRNGVKGRHPLQNRGFVFGAWGESSPEDFGKWILGSTTEKGGPFLHFSHAVNYLESHDDYTLGDFIRLATGSAYPGQVIREIRDHVRLRPDQLRIARLAAVVLLVSRGAVMLHAGQEYARSKIIANRPLTDIHPGVLDHNSYEKDDDTNWLNYEHADWNSDLLEYYRGLIALRNKFRTLRRAPLEHYRFLSADAAIAGGFVVTGLEDEQDMVVLINANSKQPARYELLERREWMVLADESAAGIKMLRSMEAASIVVAPASCLILAARRP